MRVLFEDVEDGRPSQLEYLRLTRVYLPQTADRRDLWFLIIMSSDGPWSAYAYPTRAAAIAAIPAGDTNWLAWRNNFPNAGGTTTFTDNPAIPPDLTRLTVVHTGTPPPPDGPNRYAIWGYVSAPDLVVADKIANILTDHAGAGRALDIPELGTFPEIIVGDCGKVKPSPVIQITTTGLLPLAGSDAAHAWAGRCGVSILTQTSYLEAEALGAPVAWRLCCQLQDAILSILADENRTLTLPGKGLFNPTVEKPAAVEDALAFAGVLKFDYTFPTVWRDDLERPGGDL